MSVSRGIGVAVWAAALVWAAETPDPPKPAPQVYTVGVDVSTGKLIRIPAPSSRSSSATARKAAARKSSSEAAAASPRTADVERSAVQEPAALQPESASSQVELNPPGKTLVVIEDPDRRAEVAGKEPPAPGGRASAAHNVVSAAGFNGLVERVALRYDINPGFVHAVIKAESDYNPRAVSPKGAIGLMQLMPPTARRFGVSNVYNPVENLEGGVRYLRHLLDLYNYDPKLSLAAYNAGEGAVERFRGIPPYSETRRYVRRVSEIYSRSFVWLAPAPAPKKIEGPRIYRVVEPSGTVRYVTEPRPESQ